MPPFFFTIVLFPNSKFLHTIFGRFLLRGFAQPPDAPDIIDEVPAKVKTKLSAKSGLPLCPILFFISAFVFRIDKSWILCYDLKLNIDLCNDRRRGIK